MRPPRVRTARARSLAGCLLVALAVLTASACGSNLSPETVAQANGGTYDTTGAGGALEGGGPAGSGPGSVTGPDGSTSSSGGGTSTGGGSTTGSTGDSGSSGGGATGSEPPIQGIKAGSCEGFDNDQTGVSEDKIVIANASDISGPVPGLFESAQLGTKAFVEYFNSVDDICGHKLEVMSLDSRAEAGADQQAYSKACGEAFAAVGSMSSFDAGGAATAENCGIPDIRSTSVTPERNSCSTCFSAQAVSPNLVPTAVPKYWVQKEPDAVKHVGMLYVNVGAAKVNAESWKKAWSANGWNIDYFQAIDVDEFNYTPFVQQMEDRDIDFVVYVGPYQYTVRLQDAMAQQNFEPSVFLQDSTIYVQDYVDSAGENGEGSYVYSTTALFDDFSIQEMETYRAWLEQVKPGAEPDMYGLYAWSATRLFVEKAVALGAKLNRETLIQAISQVKDWTGHGLHAPQQVGAKTTTNCVKMFQLNGGKWGQVSPGDYMCGQLFDSGIGG